MLWADPALPVRTFMCCLLPVCAPGLGLRGRCASHPKILAAAHEGRLAGVSVEHRGDVPLPLGAVHVGVFVLRGGVGVGLGRQRGVWRIHANTER